MAIAAKKLGFKEVFGTDIDTQAIEAARTNAEQNQTVIKFQLPDDIDRSIGQQQFDVVIANILANPLQVLAPALVARVRDGGQLVLSGILDRQAHLDHQVQQVEPGQLEQVVGLEYLERLGLRARLDQQDQRE